ncbi:MAG: AAA family ATPase, partial [Actinomycetota bacterium]
MIPIRLTLKDFLSYADPDTIDFTGFDVACLSGENGAGKSALLDAVTWSVFGAARGCEGGQNQDRLIRDGSDEALVDFEFGLQDASFRVVRRRSRTGKSELRFLVGGDGAWRNIAGESLRETESRIAQTLRMDYKTFTASAFFIQSRAEDFLSRMRPEERKEVFARLLDLGVYEQLEDAARIKAREAAVRRTEHARRADEIAGRSEDVGSVESALGTCAQCVQQANAELDEAMAEVEKQRAVVNELEKAEARIA